MRNVSCLQGPEELKKIKEFAIDSLGDEEKLFVQRMDKKIKDYINNKSDSFLTFNEIVRLSCVWKKYQHLKPFLFPFDPNKRMPEIVKNQLAFVIWTAWRSNHLLGKEDLKRASILAANILSKAKPPYTYELKKEAVKIFATVMISTGYSCSDDLRIFFWTEKIFPYLEGVWEFKWERKS